MTGTVKNFDPKKGWGFIVPDAVQDKDVFVHYSHINSDGFKKLLQGQRVSFDLQEGDRGQYATNVQVLQ